MTVVEVPHYVVKEVATVWPEYVKEIDGLMLLRQEQVLCWPDYVPVPLSYVMRRYRRMGRIEVQEEDASLTALLEQVVVRSVAELALCAYAFSRRRRIVLRPQSPSGLQAPEALSPSMCCWLADVPFVVFPPHFAETTGKDGAFVFINQEEGEPPRLHVVLVSRDMCIESVEVALGDNFDVSATGAEKELLDIVLGTIKLAAEGVVFLSKGKHPYYVV